MPWWTCIIFSRHRRVLKVGLLKRSCLWTRSVIVNNTTGEILDCTGWHVDVLGMASSSIGLIGQVSRENFFTRHEMLDKCGLDISIDIQEQSKTTFSHSWKCRGDSDTLKYLILLVRLKIAQSYRRWVDNGLRKLFYHPPRHSVNY